MARIRTVKPEFFRHEGLQDLEIEHPGKHPMLVFEGLWTLCDKAGRFEWRPRQIKLDILPFLPFEMSETLSVLRDAGFITHYTANGKEYGFIKTFKDHQRIDGKEASTPERYPPPPDTDKNTPGTHPEHTRNEPETQPRSQEKEKEKEKEREREGGVGGKPLDHNPPEPIPDDPPPPRKRFSPPSLEEVTAYCQERKNSVNPVTWISHYTSNGWKVGKNKMVDWNASVRTWEENNGNGNGRGHPLAGKVSPTTIRNMQVLENWEPPT